MTRNERAPILALSDDASGAGKIVGEDQATKGVAELWGRSVCTRYSRQKGDANKISAVGVEFALTSREHQRMTTSKNETTVLRNPWGSCQYPPD